MLCCGKPKEPFKCNVELLDGTHITYSKAQNIKRNTKCQVLIDRICSHLKLNEKEYFGIYYLDDQSFVHWLDPLKSFVEDTTFMRAFKNLPNTLYFGVKFYAADPCALKEELTRYQFFLQLKKDILHSKLICSQKRAAEVSALALQSEIGDYHSSEHRRGYVSEFRFLPDQTEKFEMEVARLHATYKGMVPASAEMQFLKKCRQFDLYGIELHPVQGETGIKYDLGISPRGIEKFKNKQRITVFYWPRIESVNFKDQYLKIEVLSKQVRTSIHTFILPSPAMCQFVLKSIVDHHVFHRLPQHISTSTWSRKHRYSGRTETEILQSEVERDEPEVERGSSKRYPPRPKLPSDEEKKENNGVAIEVERNVTETDWSDMLGKKGGMFSNQDSSNNHAVNYMTPKNERKERNRQLQSLSDTENRHRRHRSRGRSSGEESDSPSKRRIRARARHRSNVASDGSEMSHARRRRRKYHTDTETTRGHHGAGEGKANNKMQSINSRKTKRMSKEDLSARQQLFHHIEKEYIDTTDKSPEELQDIPYTEVKTEGTPYHVRPRHHNRRHHSSGKRASGVSSRSYTQALEEGMVPALPVTTPAMNHEPRRHHDNRYASPGNDFDSRVISSDPRAKHKSKNRRSANTADPNSNRGSILYSQI